MSIVGGNETAQFVEPIQHHHELGDAGAFGRASQQNDEALAVGGHVVGCGVHVVEERYGEVSVLIKGQRPDVEPAPTSGAGECQRCSVG